MALFCDSRAEDSIKQHSYKPESGFVPDEKTAIAIAVAVWNPIYGEKQIKRQMPYLAELKDGIWHVRGTLKQPSFGHRFGGVAEAEIAKEDGRIIRVTQGR
jgi:hypothetical protein